ncbi:MAG: alpha-D-glucose phosphate-specific phosphoglucomutase [Alphaproteobacteria bacterium]
MDIKAIKTKPFVDQKTGTSGLRKKVSVFRQNGYVENFVQSVFDCLEGFEGKTLIIGGDGRYYNDKAIQTIIKMAIANQFGRIIVGQNGLLSTPAASHLINKYEAFGGLILSASHNPGGPDGDFGIKFNTAAGGSAPESLMQQINARTKIIDRYWMVDIKDIDLSQVGVQQIDAVTIEVVDSVADYVEYMQEIFDFDLLRKYFKKGIKFVFDAMNAVTGPYAKKIFEDLLGAPTGSVIHAVPMPDFGGLHPEPNLVHAKHLVDMAFSDGGPDFAAASDGDGDRYMILGRNFFLNPSDSLAVLARYLEQIPFYKGRMYGVARSMPTSFAVDSVARSMGLDCYATPTGWKYFGSLLDSGKISLCGEESFGAGSLHLHEKDGIWAILAWLSILAQTGKSVAEIMHEHWSTYGRVYCSTHNYEGLDADEANTFMHTLSEKTKTLAGQSVGSLQVEQAGLFTYTDPVTGIPEELEVVEITFTNRSRIIARLSGTGSTGATLRVYFNKEVTDKEALNADVQETLSDVIGAFLEISEIKRLLGREAPTIIT